MTDPTFSGRLFGPGLPGSGRHAAAYWHADGSLRIVVPDDHDLIAVQPAIVAGGFNAACITISWDTEQGTYSFVVETDSARVACIATVPKVLAPRFASIERTRRGVSRRFRLGWALLLLILLVPLIGIGIFLADTDAIVDYAVGRISHQQEARLGDLLLAQTRLQMKLRDSGPAADAVSSIGNRLVSGSAHRYRWFVAERPDINAFALPGGIVVVYSGLLDAAGSAEEIAGVLSHEIAHAELRHSLRLVLKSLGLRTLVSLFLGDVSETVISTTALKLSELHFSREAEREADLDGFRRLVAAQIDPRGMIRFYEKLASEKRVSAPQILSTHPATGDRLERMHREASGLANSWEPLGIDLDAARRSLR